MEKIEIKPAENKLPGLRQEFYEQFGKTDKEAPDLFLQYCQARSLDGIYQRLSLITRILNDRLTEKQ